MQDVIVAPLVGRVELGDVELGEAVAEDALVAGLVPLVDAAARATLQARARELQGNLAGAWANVEPQSSGGHELARRTRARAASAV